MTPGQAIKKANEKFDDLEIIIVEHAPLDARQDLEELREAVDILVRWVKMS